MQLGFIDPADSSSDNFPYASQSVLGLAPMLVDDGQENLLERQFLYKFVQSLESTLEGDYLESFSFNCFDYLAIGGSVDEYSKLGCTVDNSLAGFSEK